MNEEERWPPKVSQGGPVARLKDERVGGRPLLLLVAVVADDAGISYGSGPAGRGTDQRCQVFFLRLDLDVSLAVVAALAFRARITGSLLIFHLVTRSVYDTEGLR